MIKILIVEDELPISKLIEMNLADAGYQCTCVYDGESAADLLENHYYDLILLDIMLPRINGYELMEYINTLAIPTIFLTAKASVDDRVKGLRLGAEDYIVKPFAIVELLARIEVVLRRFNKGKQEFQFDELYIDTRQRIVMKAGEIVELTPKEYELFLLFVRNQNLALSRSSIFETVWETQFDGDTRTLDLHVLRLRKKLGLEDRLKTVYRIGYRLEPGKMA